MTYLYWIYNDSCNDPSSDGYIGITEDVEHRFKQHIKKNPRIPTDCKIKVLFIGTREECFILESQYRPNKDIGWNSAAGGKHGWKTGFSHSDSTKQKLKDAWTDERRRAAAEFRAQFNTTLRGQKRPKQSIAMSGKNNPMYGTVRPDHVKQAVSVAHKGKESANKIDFYCIYCRSRVSPSVAKKYHGIGKKACTK